MPKDQEPALTGAEALVAQGAIVLKAENDRMNAVAIARPRNETAVKDRALEILNDDPAAAESAYYSIPFKEHSREGDCTGKSDDACPVKEEVEGIGIEGARELARLWGNCSSRVYIGDEDDDWVHLFGVFLDLETNVRTELPLAVSKIGRYKSGEAFTLYPAKLAQAISAGVSKVARNAIVNAIPRHISRAYYERAKELVVGSGAVDVSKLLEAFATFDVSREMLEGFYQQKLEELSAEKRRNLRGLFTAIREHLIDPAQYFAAGGGSETPETGSSSDSSGVKPSPSAIAGTAEVTGGTVAPAGAEGPRTPAEAYAALLQAAENLARINPALTPTGAYAKACELRPDLLALCQPPRPAEEPAAEPLTGDAAAMADAERHRGAFPSIPVEVGDGEPLTRENLPKRLREQMGHAPLSVVPDPEPSQATLEGVESPKPNDTMPRKPVDFDGLGI